MPIKDKCQSCGETAFLSAEVLINPETGKMQCVMICSKCWKYYSSKSKPLEEVEK